MQLVYNGAHPEVVVDELSQDQVIVRGEPVDIPDALAARLLNQDTWEQAEGAETPEQKAAREQREQDEAAAAAAAQADADAQARLAADQAAQTAPTTTEGSN